MRATREMRRLDVLHTVYTRSNQMSYVMLRRVMLFIDAGCPKLDTIISNEANFTDHHEQQQQEHNTNPYNVSNENDDYVSKGRWRLRK